MIALLTGKPLETHHEDTLIINVRDVGYLVHLSGSTRAYALSHKEVTLFIHTVVRENAFDLYGFETNNELYFFTKLLDVSGIGPKSALGIIGLASTDTLYQAIVGNNISFLTSVPGIGKKTAERMCIELRDKLKDYQGNTDIHEGKGDSDVADALVALGYSEAASHQAVAQLPQDLENTQERIKEALAILNA